MFMDIKKNVTKKIMVLPVFIRINYLLYNIMVTFEPTFYLFINDDKIKLSDTIRMRVKI